MRTPYFLVSFEDFLIHLGRERNAFPDALSAF
jgi:hypothetical protein